MVIKREKIEENFHLWLRFTPVHKVENFSIFWYIAIFTKNIKFRWKTQIIEFFEKVLFGMILFLNGNKKRKNRRKLPFVIELHSRGQSGEFRNFLVHCNLYKKNIKFRWKTQIIEFFEKMLFGMILFLNGNKKRKNRRKLPFVIELHSRGQSGEFRNFLVHCNLHKKHKISLKNSNYWVFWKNVIWHDTVPKW